jgi:hypothetical protein
MGWFLNNLITKLGKSQRLSHTEPGLDLVVEDENESTSGSSEDVGKASLEESSSSLLLVDLLEAIHGSVVHLVGTSLTSGHHESTSDGIKWVRGNTSSDGDSLSEGPHGEDVGFLWVLEEHDLSGIEGSEVGGSVSDDSDDGDTESSVESLDSILGSGLLKAINQTGELSVSTGTDISGESGSCEIKWVDEAEGSGSSSSTGSHVTNEEHTWLGLWVVWAEVLLVEIFTGEVDGLSWEVTNDVGEVASPEGTDTLLLHDSAEAVTNSIVSVLDGNGLLGILNLQ